MSLQLDANAVKKAIDDEPDILWNMLNGNREMTQAVLKTAVRLAKDNIKKRLEI